MGRYYTGDIEGKFWFGIQSSDDASFFGGEQGEPNVIDYYFDKSHEDAIRSGIATCSEHLSGYRDALDLYFDANTGYNELELAQELDVTKAKLDELLTWYARLGLGEQILECVRKNGSCRFEAEC